MSRGALKNQKNMNFEKKQKITEGKCPACSSSLDQNGICVNSTCETRNFGQSFSKKPQNAAEKRPEISDKEWLEEAEQRSKMYQDFLEGGEKTAESAKSPDVNDLPQPEKQKIQEDRISFLIQREIAALKRDIEEIIKVSKIDPRADAEQIKDLDKEKIEKIASYITREILEPWLAKMSSQIKIIEGLRESFGKSAAKEIFEEALKKFLHKFEK